MKNAKLFLSISGLFFGFFGTALLLGNAQIHSLIGTAIPNLAVMLNARYLGALAIGVMFILLFSRNESTQFVKKIILTYLGVNCVFLSLHIYGLMQGLLNPNIYLNVIISTGMSIWGLWIYFNN